MRAILRLAFGLMLCAVCAVSAAAADGKEENGGCVDPAKKACGAIYFTHHVTGQLWRKLGPPSTPTAWFGSDEVPSAHPHKSYTVMWRPGGADTVPDGFQVVQTLGGSFYYRSDGPLPPDPSTLGYSKEDFAVGDALPTAFPEITRYFPAGASVKSCTREGFSYYLVVGKQAKIAYLLLAPASFAHIMPIDEVNANVAMLPVQFLGTSLDTVRDNLNYFFFGGDYEVIELSAAYYYLSHLPDSVATDLKTLTTPTATCPEFPRRGDDGLDYPDSWKQAVKSFKN